MRFRTEYYPEVNAGLELNPEKEILLLGSCFTDNIGQRMRQSRWRAISNPAGILFNPASIAMQIFAALRLGTRADVGASKTPYGIVPAAVGKGKESVDFHIEHSGERWFSPLLSQEVTESEDVALEIWKGRFGELYDSLVRSQALIVTFGTAWVYEDMERDNMIVANCHKLPQKRFRRRLLDVDEVVGIWEEVHTMFKACNIDCPVIATVSPVRHLRDSFVDNSLSKATLILAVDKLVKKGIVNDYFPAYEIFNDDLRDYRWCAPDLAHPNSQAVDYIWEKFQTRYLSEKSCKILQAGQKLSVMEEHRVMEPQGESGRKFIEKLNDLRKEFHKAHPEML